MFQVGDEVSNYSTIYTVMGVVGNRISVIDEQGQSMGGTFHMSSFTLVTPAKPRLTGMTQFLKDTEKKYETLS